MFSSGGFFLWLPGVADADIIFSSCGFFIMDVLCNKAGHYIFALWFLLLLSSSSSSLFSSHNLSGRRLDVYHTSMHGVALVRI